MKRITSLILAMMLTLSLTVVLPLTSVLAAKEPSDFTLTFDKEHVDFYYKYKEKEDRSRASDPEMFFHFAVVENDPFTVRWDGQQYVLKIPGHSFTETSHRETYSSVDTYDYPDMVFTSPGFTKREDGTIIATFSGTVSSNGKYTHNISHNNGKSGVDYRTYQYDNVSMDVLTYSKEVNADTEFRVRVSFDEVSTLTTSAGSEFERTGTDYNHNVYDCSGFTAGAYVSGYDFSKLAPATTDEEGGFSWNNTQDASSSTGDVQTTLVNAVLAITVAGVTGLAGAAAAGSAESTEDAEGDSYVLVVGKDFGDTIRKGRKPVSVRAKIVQVHLDGSETDRPDLTEMITITGDGVLNVTPTGRQGAYVTADVSAPEDTDNEKGNVNYIFTGQDGVITQTITYKLGGKPQLVFNQNMAPGSLSMDMVSTDNGIYGVDFFFHEAYKEPNSIQFSASEDFEIKYEETDRMYSYHADIHNFAHADNLFRGKENQREILITADFGEGEIVTETIYVTVYPRGLSFDSQYLKDGRLQVDTIENEKPQGLDEEFRPVYFDAVIAEVDESGDDWKASITPAKEVKLEFGNLKSEYTLDETFKYKTGRNSTTGTYYIQPECMLPMPDGKPFPVEFEVSTEANGKSYAASLPADLIGEIPDMSADWEKEKDLLLRAIQNFGLANNDHLRFMIRNAKSLTPKELRMVRYAIAREASNYYLQEGKEFTSLDESLGRYEFAFSCVKFITDQAFSYMVTIYGGGPTVEAFASPLKDMIGNFLGELSASAYWGTEIKTNARDLGTAVASGIENTISNEMGDCMTDPKNVNIKKLGGLCACFLMISFLKHFFGNGDEAGDIYDSLLASFNDMTSGVLKNAFASKISGLLKSNPDFGKTTQKYLDKIINDPALVNAWGKKTMDAATDIAGASLAEKYITETFGLVVTSANSSLMNAATKVSNGEFDMSLFDFEFSVGDSKVTINLVDNMYRITEIMWEKMMKIFYDVAKPIESKDIPPYYREMR